MDQKEIYKSYKKRKRKERLIDIMKEIIFYFWMLILCIIMFLFYVTVKAIGWRAIIFPVGLLAIWILITITVLVFQDRKSIFVKKKVLEEIVIEDSKFGTLKFVKDMNNEGSDLMCDTLNINFGKYDPEIEIRNYKEENRELYFKGLSYVYEIQNDIINNFYEEAVDYCDNWEECDENGNSITYEYIRENFYISNMYIKIEDGDVLISIIGWPGDGLLGEHDINACINCTTKNVDYVLEG